MNTLWVSLRRANLQHTRLLYCTSRGFSKPVYEPTSTINFKNKKFLLYQCNEQYDMLTNVMYLSTLPISLFAYFFGKAVYNKRIFKSILWFVPLTVFGRIGLTLSVHTAHFIKEMQLNDDGKTVEITALKGTKKTVDISTIDKVEENVFRQTITAYGPLAVEFYPISVGEQHMMIDRKGNIPDPDMFRAICNGVEINTKGTSAGGSSAGSDDDDNIIDI